MCGPDAPPPEKDYVTPQCLRPAGAAGGADGDLVIENIPLTFEGYTCE